MPLQSGSDAVLRAMRRSYRQERYLDIIDRVRAAIPAAAITTDIIVGFPGETEADFEDTLGVVRAARFASAFTFQYSPRPGTPAADLPDQVDKDVVQDRYERLIAVVEETALAGNRALVGSDVEVLVSVGEGRKDGVTGRVSGRARDGRLVHVAVGDADGAARRRRPSHRHLRRPAPSRGRWRDHRAPSLARSRGRQAPGAGGRTTTASARRST